MINPFPCPLPREGLNMVSLVSLEVSSVVPHCCFAEGISSPPLGEGLGVGVVSIALRAHSAAALLIS